MRAMRVLGVVAVVGLIGMMLWAFGQQSAATRQAALAATVAARGSAVSSIAVVLMAALMFVFMAMLAVAAGYIWLLRRKTTTDKEMNDGRFLGIPRNDGRGLVRNDGRRDGALGEDPTRMINVLMQMETLRMMREMRGQTQPVLPAVDRANEDDAPVWWG